MPARLEPIAINSRAFRCEPAPNGFFATSLAASLQDRGIAIQILGGTIQVQAGPQAPSALSQTDGTGQRSSLTE
jgi:hypothetical protein